MMPDSWRILSIMDLKTGSSMSPSEFTTCFKDLISVRGYFWLQPKILLQISNHFSLPRFS